MPRSVDADVITADYVVGTAETDRYAKLLEQDDGKTSDCAAARTRVKDQPARCSGQET